MPGRRLPGSPRAPRAMIDLLYAVGSCDETVGSWDVTGQADGLVVRVRSRQTFDAEAAAADVAEEMVKSLLPGGYETVSATASARPEGAAGDRWRGIAEVVVASD